jgi:hypothetical protein
MSLQRFVFTFGFGHNHPLEPTFNLANHYVKAPSGMSWEDAREWMVARFGDRWAFQYSREAHAGVAEFGLIELVWTEDDEHDLLGQREDIRVTETNTAADPNDIEPEWSHEEVDPYPGQLELDLGLPDAPTNLIPIITVQVDG